MPVVSADRRDPRSQLVRDKYFCVRPRPLEQWLWSKRLPSSAERVFWLHWQEGMQRGDWCSELPIRRVARECHLDASTVTRAYQLLTKLGCLRRSDPGRDPANPFQQATAITEIRLPREFLMDLNRHPNRRRTADAPGEFPKQGRACATEQATTTHGTPPDSPVLLTDTPMQTRAGEKAPPSLGLESHPISTTPSATPTYPSADLPTQSTADLFPGLTGRARLRAIAELTEPLSPTERQAYQEAIRLHLPRMSFAPDSKVSAPAQAKILQLLASLALPQPSSPSTQPLTTPTAPTPKTHPSRKLTLFELSRLRRELQSATSTASAPELLRQVVWSIEAGALRRFEPRHALHIALKKIREGQWTRPNRMPPNWARTLSTPSALDTCGHA